MTQNPFLEIKERLDIVDVVGDYLPVINSGANYKVKCPFHNDKTPSLILSPEKNIWHCFGCGAGGDVFKFVMEYENISKKEALEKLAKKAGVELKKFEAKLKTEEEKVEEKKLISRYELGLKYLKWTAQIYNKILLKILQDRNHPVTKYSLQRGFSKEIIQTFCLGYAPNGNFLLNLAKKHNLNLELLFEIGLLKKMQNEQNGENDFSENQQSLNPNYKDKFSDRLIVPVFDNFGKTVGFTGRILPGDKFDRPKYLNSPESPWFKKSQLWYGFDLNQKKIREEKKALILEGNMDVIAAFKKGINFALASQGTSFTKEQLKKLKFLTKVVWLAFDNDTAGKIASEKFFIEASQLGLEIQKVIIPEEYKDLDEWLDNFDQKNQEFKLEFLQTKPYLDYWLIKNQRELQSQDLKTQKEVILNFLKLLQNLDEIDTEHYLQKLSDLSGKSISSLKPSLLKIKAGRQMTAQDFESENQNINYKNQNEIENKIITDFQALLAFYLEQSEQSLEEVLELERLTILFKFLKVLTGEFKKYQNLNEYYQEKKEVLELIGVTQEINKTHILNYWIRLANYISFNRDQILLIFPDENKGILKIKEIGTRYQ
jgi:DNA primase